jgi:hypothetical protein
MIKVVLQQLFFCASKTKPTKKIGIFLIIIFISVINISYCYLLIFISI